MTPAEMFKLKQLLGGDPNPFCGYAPFSPSSLLGIKLTVSPDVPRYTLPEEVIPGVPWPPGFRDEINRWSLPFLGTTNMIPRGTAYMLGGGHAVMRQEDVVKISNII